ncbi:MAG: hypothetical protein NTU57_03440, partial [Candidatus Aenigmarchaeota archaeon]|nr:hypothetical protein [Candidatus Aenigmarchaeota archaeon]
CAYDPFSYACVKGSCGATCAVNGDCAASNCSQTYNDYCNATKLVEYDSDKVKDSTTVSNSTANTCLGSCSCTNNSVSCNQPPKNTYCVKGVCNATCAVNGDCADYCDGSVKHTSRTCDASSTCACGAGTTFNCNSLDGWSNTTEKHWIDNGICKEKEQLKQEYRDYNCGTSPAIDCYYGVTETKWVDTGQTRNKADGTICNDGLWCTDSDVCTTGICGGTTKNCSDVISCTIDSCDEVNDVCKHITNNTKCNDGLYCNGQETCNVELGCVGGTTVDCSGKNLAEIATCDNVPDSIHFTWDYAAAFFSICNEATDSCTTGTQTLTHTCNVDKCQAECDSKHGCATSTCSQTYNDYCSGTKLVEYDSDKVKDSTTVTGSAQNTCIYESCLCTKNTATCNPPATNTYCVKGVCGAGCSVNTDCTCGQKDGCVGIDYYDYPSYSTCKSDCTCQECTPTISKCDSRCTGSCVVQVTTGHDMNPQWSYPYTATDDIWLKATDISNGACNWLTYDIYYLWCSCPAQTPLQSAIEATKSDWSAKYDRLCSADAANYGGTNPTHSLECGDCWLRVYGATFPADSGKKFWTGSGSCEGTFQIDIMNGCYQTGYVPAVACAGKCEDNPIIIKHAECSYNMQCVAVDGAGTDQCTSDADCYYNACDYTQNACVKKATGGALVGAADECSVWSDCTHTVCNYNTLSCDVVNSKGTDECTTLSDCTDFHYECSLDDLYLCEAVPGPGTNQCNPAKPTDCGGKILPEQPVA